MVIQYDYCSLGHDESTMSSIFQSLVVTTESNSVPHCWRLQVIANTATWTWSWQDVETLSVSSEQGNPQTSSEIQEFHMAKCESISFHTVRWKKCNVCLLLRLAKTRVRPSAHRAQRQVYIGIDVQSSIEYPEARIEETNSWDIEKKGLVGGSLSIFACQIPEFFVDEFPDFSPCSGIFVVSRNPCGIRETRSPSTLGTMSLPSSSWLSLSSAWPHKVGSFHPV